MSSASDLAEYFAALAAKGCGEYQAYLGTRGLDYLRPNGRPMRLEIPHKGDETDGTVTWALHPMFNGTTAYAVLTTENGAIVIDEAENTITWTLYNSVSSAATWSSAIAQLEVEISGVVHRVKEYDITLTRETTR